MRQTDPNLSIQIEHDIVELGGRFVCDVSRAPADGESNRSTFGQVRAVEISLRWYTEGRGDTDSKTVQSVSLPVDEYGMASGRVELEAMHGEPISYDGRLIRVRWELEARTDIKLGIDQETTAEVLVVPVGGLGTYDRPHPLR